MAKADRSSPLLDGALAADAEFGEARMRGANLCGLRSWLRDVHLAPIGFDFAPQDKDYTETVTMLTSDPLMPPPRRHAR